LRIHHLSRPVERVVAFYNKRGIYEQWIKDRKVAIKWTRLSCRTFATNAVRLRLRVLAYDLGNFLRTLATRCWPSSPRVCLVGRPKIREYLRQIGSPLGNPR
jgi:hypothetical protein